MLSVVNVVLLARADPHHQMVLRCGAAASPRVPCGFHSAPCACFQRLKLKYDKLV
jgi:hypothetical protein